MDRQDWKERRSYHKISARAPLPRPAHRRIAFLALPLFAVLFFINSQAYVSRHVPPAESSQASANTLGSSAAAVEATPERVGAVIDNFVSGNWGQETVDMVGLLTNSLEQQADQPYAASTAIYLWLLATRAPLEQANDMLLTQVARYMGEVEGDKATEAVLEKYRTALRNVQPSQ